jgi:predicted NodU family carbamoyl transferase
MHQPSGTHTSFTYRRERIPDASSWLMLQQQHSSHGSCAHASDTQTVIHMLCVTELKANGAQGSKQLTLKRAKISRMAQQHHKSPLQQFLQDCTELCGTQSHDQEQKPMLFSMPAMPVQQGTWWGREPSFAHLNASNMAHNTEFAKYGA